MEIKDIKQQLSIVRVLEHYGLQMDKNGRLKCPFHEDKTPSMQIYPKSNTYCCFSSNCNAGKGDQIQFIELQEGFDKLGPRGKHQAILKAKSLLGYVPGQEMTIEPIDNKEVVNEEVQQVDYQLIYTKLKQNVLKSQKAQAYLQSRNIDLELVAKQSLSIGYNSETFPQLKQCIVFGLKNKHNQVVSLYGRSILESKEAKHFYTSNRQGLYPHYPKAETRILILTESVIDALSLLQYKDLLQEESEIQDIDILALYGTNGLTEEHTEAVKQLKHLQEIILWFDGDEAGRKAVEKYKEELKTGYPNILISHVETPENEDINSLLDGHSEEVYVELILNRKLTSDPRHETSDFRHENSDMRREISDENKKSSILPICNLNTSNPDYITFLKENLKFTLLGGISLTQNDRMRVTLKVNIEPQLSALQSIRHNLDLYNDDQVDKFCRKVAQKLEIGTSQLVQGLGELVEKLEGYRLEKQENQQDVKPKIRFITKERRELAINYLKQADLLKRTNEDIAKSGVVGEQINRLLMYLVFTSRMRDNPLHVISLGASGTGKTYLQEKISELIPGQDKLEITMLSDNAFYYFGQQELKNKLVLIEDMDGAENVLYPLRELMSKKRITKTIPIKDNKGNLKTITLQVEGPICVAGTTTKEQIYEDNANRSLLLYLDGSKEQQEAIMDYQRRASAGEIDKQQEEEIKELFQDIQSVLKPINIRNPYAPQLKIPQEVFKPLRTNTHYLQFIECITFYHQVQREIKTDNQTGEKFIETTIEDIEHANKLLKNVLLAKADELNGACRKFFEVLKKYLNQENKNSFFSNEIRTALKTNYATLKRHLLHLHRNGYIKIVGGNKFSKGYEYEVVSFDEYQALKENIQTALDDVLLKIKASSGLVVHSGSKVEMSH